MEFNQSAAQIAIEHMPDAVALFVEHLDFEEILHMDSKLIAPACERSTMSLSTNG